MEKVKLLVRCSTMLAMVKKKLAPRQPADVAWTLVAEEQTKGRLTHLVRMQTGFVREGQPEWGKHAMLVTGWSREEPDLTSELALHLQKAVMRVHRTLTRIALEG